MKNSLVRIRRLNIMEKRFVIIEDVVREISQNEAKREKRLKRKKSSGQTYISQGCGYTGISAKIVWLKFVHFNKCKFCLKENEYIWGWCEVHGSKNKTGNGPRNDTVNVP